MVVKLYLEPEVEPEFHQDSYGYRPKKSALDAVGEARRRCWRYNWVLDLDIKGFFDNIDHSLMLHAVRKHTACPWILLYVERWLKASAIDAEGQEVSRDKGTPQGGVISPLLANIFLHQQFPVKRAAATFERDLRGQRLLNGVRHRNLERLRRRGRALTLS
jgi:RNA-directed DNA polymerase